jgi:hypothetical protein
VRKIQPTGAVLEMLLQDKTNDAPLGVYAGEIANTRSAGTITTGAGAVSVRPLGWKLVIDTPPRRRSERILSVR